jgi:hypothetical protein
MNTEVKKKKDTIVETQQTHHLIWLRANMAFFFFGKCAHGPDEPDGRTEGGDKWRKNRALILWNRLKGNAPSNPCKILLVLEHI